LTPLASAGPTNQRRALPVGLFRRSTPNHQKNLFSSCSLRSKFFALTSVFPLLCCLFFLIPTVTVTVYNVGGQEAAEIEVEDEWEEDKFTLTDGSMRAAFPSLAPGEHAEFSFTLAPQFKTPSAMYEYKPAMVTYMYGEEDEQIETIATSSRPHTQMGNNQPFLDGKAYVIGEEDYEGDNAMYGYEWGIFSALAGSTFFGPLFFWFQLNPSAIKKD
jgi:hypothetical protein